MAHDMLHVIRALCVASEMHMIVPWPLEPMCWRQLVAQWGDYKKISNCAFQCSYLHHHYYCYYYYHYCPYNYNYQYILWSPLHRKCLQTFNPIDHNTCSWKNATSNNQHEHRILKTCFCCCTVFFVTKQFAWVTKACLLVTIKASEIKIKSYTFFWLAP